MAQKGNPGAFWRNATGAKMPCYAIAAGFLKVSLLIAYNNAFASRLMRSSTQDPAILAAIACFFAHVLGLAMINEELALAQGFANVETLGGPSTVSIYTPARLSNCDPVRFLKDDGGRVLACVEGAGFHDPLELAEGAQ